MVLARSLPGAEAAVRLEGAVVPAAAQAAALIAAQRGDQVHRAYITHTHTCHHDEAAPLPPEVRASVSASLSRGAAYRRCVPGPGGTGSRASGGSRGASEGPGRTAPLRCRDSPATAERWLRGETGSDHRTSLLLRGFTAGSNHTGQEPLG